MDALSYEPKLGPANRRWCSSGAASWPVESARRALERMERLSRNCCGLMARPGRPARKLWRESARQEKDHSRPAEIAAWLCALENQVSVFSGRAGCGRYRIRLRPDARDAGVEMPERHSTLTRSARYSMSHTLRRDHSPQAAVPPAQQARVVALARRAVLVTQAEAFADSRSSCRSSQQRV